MGILDALFSKTIDKRVNSRLNTALRSVATNNILRFALNTEINLSADNYKFIEEGYESVAAVYECIDIIVNKIIACPRIVYKVKDEKEYKKYLNFAASDKTYVQAAISKALALEEVTHEKINALIDSPNPEQNTDQMLEIIAGLLLATGNSYLYGNAGAESNLNSGKWSEIWAIPTEMSIKSKGFMQPIESYSMTGYAQTNPFPAKQIKHFKTRNLGYGQQLFGMAPLRAYLYSLDILKNADKQSDKQIKNGGKLGLISPENKEDNFSEPQLDQLGKDMQTALESNDAMARLVPLSVAVKYQQIGLSSQEMELLQTADAKADDIYRCYHIPLQFRSQDTATYNNLPVANRQLIYNAVYPWLRKIEQGLTEFICSPYNTKTEKYIIMLDYTSLPELASDAKETSEWLDKFPWLTPNEKRQVINFGKLSQEGLDEIYVNRNTVRLQDVIDGKVQTTQNDQSGSRGTN